MKIKNFLTFLKSKLGLIYSKNKKLFIFVLLFITVIAVCVFMFPSNKEKDKSSLMSENLPSENVDDYKTELEQKLKQMLLSIDEIEFASVMVVCDESEKYVYLKNLTQTTSGSGDSASKTITEEVVYEKNGSNSLPIIVSRTMPKVVGVWIIIDSVSPSTKLAITNSICSVLNIDESSISILQGR